MPSTSKSQQRLMSQAYGVKLFQKTNGKHGLNPDKIDSEYRDRIVSVADRMSLRSLKHFVTEVKENSTIATVDSVSGMGSVQIPNDNKIGSGDIQHPIYKEYNKINKMKKRCVMKNIEEFDDFCNRIKNNKT